MTPNEKAQMLTPHKSIIRECSVKGCTPEQRVHIAFHSDDGLVYEFCEAHVNAKQEAGLGHGFWQVDRC